MLVDDLTEARSAFGRLVTSVAHGMAWAWNGTAMAMIIAVLVVVRLSFTYVYCLSLLMTIVATVTAMQWHGKDMARAWKWRSNGMAAANGMAWTTFVVLASHGIVSCRQQQVVFLNMRL